MAGGRLEPVTGRSGAPRSTCRAVSGADRLVIVRRFGRKRLEAAPSVFPNPLVNDPSALDRPTTFAALEAIEVAHIDGNECPFPRVSGLRGVMRDGVGL